MSADVKKILMDLQYRIDSTPESDPERENAIRLRDRLLAKHGMALKDIVEVRTERRFEKLSDDEQKMVCQYFMIRLNTFIDRAPYSLNSYKRKGSKTKYRNFVQVFLTDDEYRHHYGLVNSLVSIYRRKMRDLDAELKKEAKAKRKALEYIIYERADILFPEGWNGKEAAAPEWSLRDAMEAARSLEDTIFPKMQLRQDPLRLAKEG